MDKRIAEGILKLMVKECQKLEEKPDEISVCYSETNETYYGLLLFINYHAFISRHDESVLRRMSEMVHTYFPTVIWQGQRHNQYDYESIIKLFSPSFKTHWNAAPTYSTEMESMRDHIGNIVRYVLVYYRIQEVRGILLNYIGRKWFVRLLVPQRETELNYAAHIVDYIKRIDHESVVELCDPQSYECYRAVFDNITHEEYK